MRPWRRLAAQGSESLSLCAKMPPASIAGLIAAGQGVPDPDSEVPMQIRDEIFSRMKAKPSERVRLLGFWSCVRLLSERRLLQTGPLHPWRLVPTPASACAAGCGARYLLPPRCGAPWGGRLQHACPAVAG